MTADYDKSLLLEADQVVRERENQHASPLENGGEIAVRWTTRLRRRGKLKPGAFIDPDDVGWMMVDLKQSRDAETCIHDNLLDTAGYASFNDRIDQEMKALGYAEGRAAFRTMAYHDLIDLMERLTNGATDKAQSSSG